MPTTQTKILLTSDWHLFGPAGDRFTRLGDLKGLCESERPDVVVHAGDLVEPEGTRTYEDGLRVLAEATRSVKNVLTVAGNNDLDAVVSSGVPFKDAMARMFLQCAGLGIVLLDEGPWRVGPLRFAGGHGGFDGSLFRETELSRGQTAAVHMEAEGHRWQKYGLDALPGEFFAACRRKLLGHLAEDAETPTVLVTHTVPAPELVRYGSSEKYDWLNTYMGWDEVAAGAELWKGPVKAHLCGHVHRSYSLILPTQYGDVPLYNASGNDDLMLLIVEQDDHGRVSSVGHHRV